MYSGLGDLVSRRFIMVFTCIVIIYGIQMIAVTINQRTPALQVPILVVYLAFPLSGLLMFFETLVLFLKLASVKNEIDLETLHKNDTKLGRG